MKLVTFLILLSVLSGCSVFSQKSRGISGEEVDCEQVVQEKSGTIDHSRCKDSEKKWACYEVVEKTCVEKTTKNKQSLKEKRFTGKCGDLSDCW